MKETRRKFSSAFKAEVALEAIKGVKTTTELAQEYQVHPVQINTWKKTFLERRSNIFEGDKKHEQELKRLREDRDELYLEDPTRGTRRMSKELKKLGYQSAVDITYVPMEKGFLYLFAIMDLRSRCIVGWSLSNTMEADWVISTLKQAIAQHGKPEIINSDQGSQFTSKDYVDYIKSLESTKISMDGKGRAIDNVFIERFWRTIKCDKLYLYTIENGHHALELCEEFMEYYNHKRMHSSIDDKTPMQLYKEAA